MLSTSKIQLELDHDEIKEYIKTQIDKNIRREKLFVDINDLVKITSCSKRWLEEEVLNDPRIKIYERRKNRKRLWLYKETVNALKEIASDWWII